MLSCSSSSWSHCQCEALFWGMQGKGEKLSQEQEDRSEMILVMGKAEVAEKWSILHGGEEGAVKEPECTCAKVKVTSQCIARYHCWVRYFSPHLGKLSRYVEWEICPERDWSDSLAWSPVGRQTGFQLNPERQTWSLQQVKAWCHEVNWSSKHNLLEGAKHPPCPSAFQWDSIHTGSWHQNIEICEEYPLTLI